MSQLAVRKVFAERGIKSDGPSLAERQKIYRDLRDQAVQKQIAGIQQTEEQVKPIVEGTIVIVGSDPETGKWQLVDEGGRKALAVFTKRAFFDDYSGFHKLPYSPAEVSIAALFARLAEFAGVDGLTFDRCPRCADAREFLELSNVPDDVNTALNAALKETDREKRRAGFQNVLEHFDPVNDLARQELERL